MASATSFGVPGFCEPASVNSSTKLSQTPSASRMKPSFVCGRVVAAAAAQQREPGDEQQDERRRTRRARGVSTASA